MKRQVHGTGMQHITKDKFEKTLIPLPPLSEQSRIVTRIKELLTEIYIINLSIKKNDSLIQRFRQSVLASAFRGTLVSQNPNDEPGSVLFETIQEKKKKMLGKKYKKPILIDLKDIPKLPKGWEWVRLEDVIKDVQYGTSDKASEIKTNLPVLRMNNIQDGKLEYTNIKYLNDSFDYSQFILNDGDIIFNRTNTSNIFSMNVHY